MQFIITAYDGTDEQALERRMQARDAHLKSVEQRFKAGQHLYGAAMLDEEGKMIGSTMIVEFASREAVDEWLNEEPYVIGGVWQRIEIQPCKVAPLFMELYKR